MIKKEDLRDGKGTIVYSDEKEGRTYQAIIAAMAWPGIKLGCLVVGALEQRQGSGKQKEPIHILKDKEISSPQRLLQEIDDYHEMYKFQTVFLDNRSRAMMQNLSDFRGERKEEGVEVGWGTSPAPLLDDLNVTTYYKDKIGKRLLPGGKSLFFAEDSILPTFLGSIKYDELKGATIESQPLIFTLGAVVCQLDKHKVVNRQLAEVRERRERLFEEQARRNPLWNPPGSRVTL